MILAPAVKYNIDSISDGKLRRHVATYVILDAQMFGCLDVIYNLSFERFWW